MRLGRLTLITSTALSLACSTKSSSTPNADAGAAGDDQGALDASVDVAPVPIPAAACDGGMCIQHVVVIVQENHTFDDHFGAYCTAAPGSNPTCTDGPACCEAMPATDPSGTTPTVLTDAAHAAFDPNHTRACELAEIDDGKMDRFANAPGSNCGDPRNVAIADPSIVKPYWQLAAESALADRYFQPIAGESSANDMYLARAQFVFDDNDVSPQGAVGTKCDVESNPGQYTDPTIGDLLTTAGVSWAWFSEGYDAMVAANGACPPKPADCPFVLDFYPCAFEPADIPIEYYRSTSDNPSTMKDLSKLQSALASGSGLPVVSFVKAIGYKQEHPGTALTLSAGVDWAMGLVNAIESSAYGPSTLVLLTYDEGGGYFDHVAPPAASSVDGKPYGTRIPLMAIGPFARKNHVSHVPMEHSSIVKFLEWYFLGQKTGQLGGRDAVVNDLGSLIDPGASGVAVPEN
jgi:phospholipase C